MSVSKEVTVLTSWKEISRCLGKGVRTAQRWERELGLPVRRPDGNAVLLHREELDAWLEARFAARKIEGSMPHRVPADPGFLRAELREKLRTARELTDTHLALIEQIAESIHLLKERCRAQSARSLRNLPDAWAPRSNEHARCHLITIIEAAD